MLVNVCYLFFFQICGVVLKDSRLRLWNLAVQGTCSSWNFNSYFRWQYKRRLRLRILWTAQSLLSEYSHFLVDVLLYNPPSTITHTSLKCYQHYRGHQYRRLPVEVCGYHSLLPGHQPFCCRGGYVPGQVGQYHKMIQHAKTLRVFLSMRVQMLHVQLDTILEQQYLNLGIISIYSILCCC